MKTLYAIVIFVVLTAISTVAYTDQVPVNIVYPINGATYPMADISPHGDVHSYYQPASFSVTCPGGGHKVEWGMDKDPLGQAKFYDQMSMQFVWKLPAGDHVFWVKASCGENKVEFTIK